MKVSTSLKSVPDPLGIYFRAGHVGHLSLHKRLLESDDPRTSGVLFSAAYSESQVDLRQELRARHLEAVLDTQALELATISGFERSALQRLPWAGNRIHRPEDLASGAGLELAEAVSKHAVTEGYGGMLSPNHFLKTADDPWLEVDRRNTARLRRYLDANGGERLPMYYLLAIHGRVLWNPEARRQILEQLGDLDIDGLWLRIHPFGYDAGPIALRRYIEACRDLHQLGVPIVGERVGSAGLALLAFGALGGICCGLTLGEKFDALILDRRRPSGGNMAPRVYVEALGAFLSKEQAEAFYSQRNRTHARYGCRDKNCCRRGVADTLADPQRHFFHARTREVGWLGNTPPTARPAVYMNDFLRPASDQAIRAAQLEPALERVRKQLGDWREALRVIEASGVSSHARAPTGKRLRRDRIRAQGR